MGSVRRSGGSEVTYIVYVDGVIVSESDKTEYTLKNADESKGYVSVS